MRPVKLALTLILLLLLAAAALAAQTWWGQPLKLRWFYDRNFIQEIIRTPSVLSRLQVLDRYGLAWYSNRLDDYSVDREYERYARLHRDFEAFKRYDGTVLTGEERVSWQIARHQFDDRLEGEKWRWYDYPVNSLSGVQTDLPSFMINVHPIRNAGDARDYITRLHAIPRALDQVLAGLQQREAQGLLPLRFSVEKTIAQMVAFIEPAAADHVLVTSLRDKINGLPAGSVTAETRRGLLAEAEQTVGGEVYPIYQTLIAHLRDVARQPLTNDGIWRLPNGDAYYDYLVRHYTTTSLSADEIHQLGLAEVARIGGEIDTILAAEDLPGAARAERFAALAARSDQRYSDDDAGRAAVLRDYQAIIDDAERKTHETFPLRPDSRVVVQAVPKFAEMTTPGGYYEYPSLDGSRPGTFFVNLHRIDATPKFGMHTLAYHETIPGHHFQIALQMQMTDLPLFRRAAEFTAFVEGWALYAERCAWELGFTKDPLDNLGRLRAELFRAVRLVVDTGMHARHWSREQAIAYMRTETGVSEDGVTVEIERYLIDPGQALAYKIGMQKIVELRDWAQTELGADFRLDEFHRLVLKNGAVPLTVLTDIVHDWVDSQRRAAPPAKS